MFLVEFQILIFPFFSICVLYINEIEASIYVHVKTLEISNFLMKNDKIVTFFQIWESSTSFRFEKFQWKVVTIELSYNSYTIEIPFLFCQVINCSLDKRIWVSWEWIWYSLLRFHLMGIVGLWQKKHDSCKHTSSFLLFLLCISCVFWCTFFLHFLFNTIFI